MAWFGPAPFSEHTFFPLWLGYILAVDGFTARRVGTSLFSRDPRRFVLLLADLSETNGNVTPTMKLKRGAFTERARHIVENMYADTRSQA